MLDDEVRAANRRSLDDLAAEICMMAGHINAANYRWLTRDPSFAAHYLDAVLEDGDQDELLLALRRLSSAFGGVPKLAARAKLNPTTLYRTLSEKGNPELRSMNALLKAMGMRLSVQAIPKTRKKKAA